VDIDKRKIADIVDNNYVNASVLYYFGISFFDYSEETLEQACRDKGLDVKVVIEKLESKPCNGPDSIHCLKEYPIDLIVEYLKHTHYLFIKQKLPYLAKLIKNITPPVGPSSQIVEDLKFVFPLFVEDFIHHIYEEEDTLFSYVLNLNEYLKNHKRPTQVYWEMENSSLQQFAVEHDQHDDEMEGIRKITKDYDLSGKLPLPLRVVYAELQSLENDLKTHARVENEILFPKALSLEKEAISKLKRTIIQN